jgi:hypothetical protein
MDASTCSVILMGDRHGLKSPDLFVSFPSFSRSRLTLVFDYRLVTSLQFPHKPQVSTVTPLPPTFSAHGQSCALFIARAESVALHYTTARLPSRCAKNIAKPIAAMLNSVLAETVAPRQSTVVQELCMKSRTGNMALTSYHISHSAPSWEPPRVSSMASLTT